MYVMLTKRNKMTVADVRGRVIDKLSYIIGDMRHAESYAELYTLLKLFIKHTVNLPDDTPKCREWKDAFKGIGAYETLKNMVLFHDVVLSGCVNKEESLTKLNRCLHIYQGEGWRMHALLKETIRINNFDLRRSIEAHK
jgi:hypothetical protein